MRGRGGWSRTEAGKCVGSPHPEGWINPGDWGRAGGGRDRSGTGGEGRDQGPGERRRLMPVTPKFPDLKTQRSGGFVWAVSKDSSPGPQDLDGAIGIQIKTPPGRRRSTSIPHPPVRAPLRTSTQDGRVVFTRRIAICKALANGFSSLCAPSLGRQATRSLPYRPFFRAAEGLPRVVGGALLGSAPCDPGPGLRLRLPRPHPRPPQRPVRSPPELEPDMEGGSLGLSTDGQPTSPAGEV